jgi:Fe-S-cluster containining protein
MQESPPPWFAAGLRFTCQRCGACCTGEPGYVFLRRGEAEAIAAFLGADPATFLAEQVRRVPGGVSLLEEADGRCAFFADGCRIYPARPRQCRTYPFWKVIVASPGSWEREGRSCPGIGTGALHEAGEIAVKAGLALEGSPPGPLSSSP